MQSPLFFLSFFRLSTYVTNNKGKSYPTDFGSHLERKGGNMFVENICRRLSGVESAQKKASVLVEAGMETSKASKEAGLYESILKMRILEIKIYLIVKIPVMMICGVGAGAFLLLMLLKNHNALLVASAVACISGWAASDWLRRKIWDTEAKICHLDRLLSKKGSAYAGLFF